MNGNGKIGVESARIRAESRSGASSMTNVVESHESGMRGISRSKGFRSAYDRRSRNRKVSILLVCAAAVVVILGLALAPVGVGQKNSKIMPVGPLAAPVAAFTFSVSGPTLSVDGSTSTGTGLSYEWSWGDQWLSTGVTNSHKYLSTADWTVTLTVTDNVGATASSTQVIHVVNAAPPGTPYSVLGPVVYSDGVTPASGCSITLTVARTGDTYVSLIPTDVDGFFSVPVDLNYILDGDTLTIHALSPDLHAGTGTGVVSMADFYTVISVTLSATVIPEFPSIVIPIVGMLSMFVVAVAVSKRGKEE